MKTLIVALKTNLSHCLIAVGSEEAVHHFIMQPHMTCVQISKMAQEFEKYFAERVKKMAPRAQKLLHKLWYLPQRNAIEKITM